MSSIIAHRPPAAPSAPRAKPWYGVLYWQVLLAVGVGILVGWMAPGFAKSLKPLGDAFIKVIKMLIAPIVFCTVVHGIASMGDLRKLGRVGAKTLLYFEVVSTIALAIGLVVVNSARPGEGFNIDVRSLDPTVGKGYVQKAQTQTASEFLLNIIPQTMAGAFTSGDLLPVLFVSILVAFALSSMGEKGRKVLHAMETLSEVLFAVMRLVVRAAPVGAFGAMAFTVGSYGLGSLNKLFSLMAGFYTTAILFVVVVLGAIARACGFSIFKLLRYIREELLLVLGTSSSETALPGVMEKLTRLGCSRSTVGLVIPTGYSFNLDGTNIYMSMAAVFLAQATNTPLDLRQQLTLLFVAMVTSKGATGVTGSGFVTLAATMAAVPTVPMESLALLVGIDRFMSECRALTNLVGNAVATVVISRWEGELNPADLRRALSEQTNQEPVPRSPA